MLIRCECSFRTRNDFSVWLTSLKASNFSSALYRIAVSRVAGLTSEVTGGICGFYRLGRGCGVDNRVFLTRSG